MRQISLQEEPQTLQDGELHGNNQSNLPILRTETYGKRNLNRFPIDASLKLQKMKNMEQKIIQNQKEFHAPNYEIPPKSLHGHILTAKLHKKYDANLYAFGERPEMPIDILSQWVSETGILNLIDRSVVPAHADVSPALRGANDKKYLRPLKARMFPISFKTDHGSIWEQPRRVYLPALRLAPPEEKRDTIDDHVMDTTNSSRISISESHQEWVTADQKRVNPEYATGWVIYIQKGQLQEHLPGYKSFIEKTFEIDCQIQASYILETIVNLSVTYSIPLVTLDCTRIIGLIQSIQVYPIPKQKLMECIFNRVQVEELIQRKPQLFLNGDVGREFAAKTIQYYYYRHRTRLQRKQDELTFRAKRRIMAFYLRYKSKKSFLKVFKEKMILDRQVFMQLQNSFLREGASLYAKRRILLFICPPEEKNLFERIYHLQANQDVTVILVVQQTPEAINEQVAKIYDTAHFGDPLKNGRLHIVTSDITHVLPQNAEIGASLLLSIQALNKVKEICNRRYPIVIAERLTPYITSICKELSCSFLGPNYKVACAIAENPLLVHSWLIEADIPILPSFKLEKRQILEVAQDECKKVVEENSQIKKWIFQRFDRFGNKQVKKDILDSSNFESKFSSAICSTDTLRLFWVFGGLLEGLPPVDTFKKIQLGIILETSGRWNLVATTESHVHNLEDNGIILPQQSLKPEEISQISIQVVECLKEKTFNGFVTIILYAWHSFTTNSFETRVSSVLPYFNEAIIHCLSITVKSRLILDPATCHLHLDSSKTPWTLPYLGNSSNSDSLRVNEHFKKRIPTDSKRIVFSCDLAKHDVFQHLKGNLCSVSLQRRGLQMDSWTLEGIEFRSLPNCFNIICIDHTIQSTFEMYLAALASIEVLAAESEYEFRHNLPIAADSIMTLLQNVRSSIRQTEFEEYHPGYLKNAYAPLSLLLKPYIAHKFMPTEVPANAPPPIIESAPRNGPSAETVKLLAEEIASKIAFQKDPSLKNPMLVAKVPHRKGIESRKAEERANALISLLENEKLAEGVKDQPWRKLILKANLK